MGKDTPFLSSENIQICGRLTKLDVIKCNLFAFSSILAEYLQKFEFLISQGIVATRLRWGGRCHMSFVANFIRFPAVKKIWESVKIWQSYKRVLKVGPLFETQCRLHFCHWQNLVLDELFAVIFIQKLCCKVSCFSLPSELVAFFVSAGLHEYKL